MSAVTFAVMISREPSYLRALPVALGAGALAAWFIKGVPLSRIQGMSVPLALLFQVVATCSAIAVSKYLQRRNWRGLAYQAVVPTVSFVAGIAALKRTRLPINERALVVNVMIAHLFALLFQANFKYRL